MVVELDPPPDAPNDEKGIATSMASKKTATMEDSVRFQIQEELAPECPSLPNRAHFKPVTIHVS